MEIESKIKDKIKKLMALAASDNEHEAAAALRQAMKLMAKHGLSEADIKTQEIITIEVEHDYIKIPPYCRTLFNLLSKAFGVYYVYRQGRRGYHKATSILTGKDSDVKRAEYLYFVAHALIEKETNKYIKNNPQGVAADYRIGMAQGLGRKVIDSNKEVEEEITSSTCKDLVPVDTRRQDAEDLYKKDNKVSLNVYSRNFTSSYNHGVIDGKKATLTEGVNGNKTSSLA